MEVEPWEDPSHRAGDRDVKSRRTLMGQGLFFCVSSMHKHHSEPIIADVLGNAVSRKTQIARGRRKKNNKQKLVCVCVCLCVCASHARSFPAIRRHLTSIYINIFINSLHTYHYVCVCVCIHTIIPYSQWQCCD